MGSAKEGVKQFLSGTKKEHKPKLWSPDIFRWSRGLPHEGGGAKSSVCPSKPGKSNFFLAGYPVTLPSGARRV